MDSTNPEHGNDKDALQLAALVAWVKAQPNRAEAQRRLEEASGIAINYKAFGRVVTDGPMGQERRHQTRLAGAPLLSGMRP